MDKEIISSANAIGLMQLLPSTAHQIAKSRGEKIPNEDDLKTPRTNIMLGVDYLKRLLKEFGNNPVYALASYNAGEQNVRRWIKLRPGLSLMEFVESIPYIETRGYVKNVLRNYYLYSAFYNNRSLKTDELFDIWVND